MWFSSPAGSGLPKLLVALVQAIEGVLPWQTFSKVSAPVLVFFISFVFILLRGDAPLEDILRG